MGHDVAWTDVLVWEGPVWLYWAFATLPALWLAARFPIERRRLARNLAVHTASAVFFALLYIAVWMLWNQNISPYSIEGQSLSDMIWTYVRARFTIAFLIYWAIVGIGHAWSNYQRYREREIEAARLQELLAQARIQALKMQLHPHFLFNALHAAATLMDEDVAAARRLLARLGELLRTTLEVDEDEVALERELEFLAAYLEVERVRFQDRLAVRFEVASDTLAGSVPPFLLQPLVENAIRHGVNPRANGGCVTVRAQRADGRMRLEVEDDGPGVDAETAAGAAGIGLRNTRERLRQHYGDGHELRLEAGRDGGLKVTIDLPYRPSEAPSPRGSLGG